MERKAEETRIAEKKQEKIFAICFAVVAVLILLWANMQTKANTKRAEQIMANFPGKIASYTDRYKGEIIYEDEYNFYKNGKVDEIFIDRGRLTRYGRQDDSVSKHTYDYSVQVLLF